MRPGGDSKNDAATRSVIELEPTTRGAAHGRAASPRGAWWSSAFEPAPVGAGRELQHIAMVVVGLESVFQIVWCGWSAARFRRTLPAIALRGGAPRSRDRSAPPDAVSSSRAGPCAFLPDSLPASGGYQMSFMLFAQTSRSRGKPPTICATTSSHSVHARTPDDEGCRRHAHAESDLEAHACRGEAVVGVSGVKCYAVASTVCRGTMRRESARRSAGSSGSTT